MAVYGEIGQRLIPSLIDEYSQEEPHRVWASVPIDDNDLTQGYEDITYVQLANAINHASRWLNRNLPTEASDSFSTFAYAGPKDLRYPILAVAAAKCRKRILLCSPFASADAQVHLLKAAGCLAYLHSPELKSVVDGVVASVHDTARIGTVLVPELEHWLKHEPAPVVPFARSWDEAGSDDWLIFHTSGTTGMPKLITYTLAQFNGFDVADLMTDTDPGEETMNDLFRNRRFYVALPHLHLVGMMSALQNTVYLNMVLVMGPTSPASGAQVLAILHNADVQGALMPPSLIEDVSRQAGGIDALRQLYVLYFAGAPIAKHVAIQLNKHCKLLPGFGSTETGPAYMSVRNGEADQWEYHRWREPNGVKFEPRSENLFESVVVRQPGLERFQQVFQFYPHLDKYSTGDLWTQHPTRKALWKYAGRKDDMVIFSHGEDLHATGMEQAIQEHPNVRAALIGGEGRPRPFLLIDLVDTEFLKENDAKRAIDGLWPSVEKANQMCSDYVKLTRELIIFTDVQRPLPLTAKGTVQRRAALDLYQQEISQLYAN